MELHDPNDSYHEATYSSSSLNANNSSSNFIYSDSNIDSLQEKFIEPSSSALITTSSTPPAEAFAEAGGGGGEYFSMEGGVPPNDLGLVAGEVNGDAYGQAPQQKRAVRLSMIAMFYVASFIGYESSVILPTMIDLIIALDPNTSQASYFSPLIIGLSLSAYYASVLLISPLASLLAVKVRYNLVLFLGMMLIALGNVVYLLSVTPYMMIAARLIAGIGAASYACILTFVHHVTPAPLVTKRMIGLRIASSSGLVSGPGESCPFYLFAAMKSMLLFWFFVIN